MSLVRQFAVAVPLALSLAACISTGERADRRADNIWIEPDGMTDHPWPIIILFDHQAPTAPPWTREGIVQLEQYRVVVPRARLDQEFRIGSDTCARDGARVVSDIGDVVVSGRTARRGHFECRLGPAAACAYLAALNDRSGGEPDLLEGLRDMRLRLGCITLRDEAAG